MKKKNVLIEKFTFTSAGIAVGATGNKFIQFPELRGIVTKIKFRLQYKCSSVAGGKGFLDDELFSLATLDVNAKTGNNFATGYKGDKFDLWRYLHTGKAIQLLTTTCAAGAGGLGSGDKTLEVNFEDTRKTNKNDRYSFCPRGNELSGVQFKWDGTTIGTVGGAADITVYEVIVSCYAEICSARTIGLKRLFRRVEDATSTPKIGSQNTRIGDLVMLGSTATFGVAPLVFPAEPTMQLEHETQEVYSNAFPQLLQNTYEDDKPGFKANNTAGYQARFLPLEFRGMDYSNFELIAATRKFVYSVVPNAAVTYLYTEIEDLTDANLYDRFPGLRSVNKDNCLVRDYDGMLNPAFEILVPYKFKPATDATSEEIARVRGIISDNETITSVR